MSALVALLKDLTRSKRLQPAEQIILQKLIPFEEMLPHDLPDAEFTEIESLLLKLLLVNNGELSMPCSLRIGVCLSALYAQKPNSKIWNVLTTAHKNQCKAVLYCAGFLVDKFSNNAKSMIQGFVSDLVGAKPVFAEPALYALNVCFKRAPQECVKMIDKAFLTGKKALNDKLEILQLRGLGLMRTLVKVSPPLIPKVLACLKALATMEVSVLVLDEVSHLLAKMAFLGLDDKVEVKGEFQVGARSDDTVELKKALVFLLEIPRVQKQTLKRFLSMLSLSYIHRHMLVLFEWIRANSFDNMNVFFAYLSSEDLDNIYENVITEDIAQEQLQLLELLTRDEDATRATASLALQLLTIQPSKAKGTECSFFRNLTNKYPPLASNYLKAAIMFLHNPPDTQNVNREVIGMAMVAAEILSVDNGLAEPLKDKIVDYIPRALDSKFWEAHYQAAFLLMATLPEDYWPRDSAAKQLNEFAKYCGAGVAASDVIKGNLQSTALTVALFIANHADVDGAAQALISIHGCEDLESFATKLCIVLAFPRLKMTDQQQTVLAQMVRAWANSTAPSPEYVKSRLDSPMLTQLNLVRLTPPSPATDVPVVFFYVHSTFFAEKCAELFPGFIMSLSQQLGLKFVTTFVASQLNCPIAPAVLLELLLNDNTKKLLPVDVHARVLESLIASEHAPRVQLFSECLGLCVKLHPEVLPEVGKCIERIENPRHKCLAYAGIFSKYQASDDFLISAMHELNGMAFNAESSAYALYALDVLYQTNMIQLSMLALVNDQPTFFVGLLNSQLVMRPFVMFYAAKAFNSLLAIVSPELENERKFIAPGIQILIQGFGHLKLPYARQIYNSVLRAVLALAKHMTPTEIVSYPMSKGCSYQTKLSCCGVLCDFLKATEDNIDYFDIVHDVIRTLQLTSDRRASEFIQEIAAHFVRLSNGNESNDAARLRLKQWTNLIKLYITKCQSSGERQIVVESSDMVKKCCISVSRILLPVVKKSEPLMADSLDDLVTSAIRCIDSTAKDLVAETYTCLGDVLTTFGNVTDAQGHRVLGLYDAQFSTAVHLGFDNLSLCGTFMLNFLSYHIDELRNSPDDFLHLLDIFITGMSKTKERSSTFVSIAAQIVVAARVNRTVLEHVLPVEVLFCETLGATVSKAKELWTTQPPKWAEIASFRTEYSTLYSEIVTGFVWLQSQTKANIISPQELHDFFLNDINNCKEGWRIVAATHGLVSLIECYSSDITDAKLHDILSSVGEGDKMTSSSLPPFIEACATRLASHPDSWKLIASLIERHNCCSAKSLAFMLYHGQEELLLEHANKFIQIAGEYSGDSGLALATIIFEKIPAKGSEFLEQTLSNEHLPIEYKMAFIFKYLSHTPEISQDSPVLQFSFQHLFRGGIDVLVHIITKMNLCLVDCAEFRDIFTKDYIPPETITMLQLAMIAITTYGTIVSESYDTFVQQVLDFVFRAEKQYGTSLEFGKEMWKYGSAILNFCRKEYEKFVRISFKNVPIEYQREFLETVERIYNRMLPQKRGMSLKLFSTKTSGFRKDDDVDQKEWHTLIVSDEP